MAYSPIATEYGAIYTLTNGAWTAVFNDPTDPNYVGMLTEVTGLDSAEVRENSTDLVEADGGVHGSFYMGRRPIVMTGKVFGHSTVAARSLRLDKARNASLALRSDATLSWMGSSYNYRGTVMGLTPSQYLRLSETTGTVATDASNNSRTGTYNGGFTLGQPSPTVDGSTSVAFNGTSGYVATTYQPFGAADITVAGWALRNTNSTIDALFGTDGVTPALKGAAGSNDASFTPDNTNVAAQTYTAAFPAPGNWFHWALVWNQAAKQATLYVNGVSAGTKTFAQGFNVAAGNLRFAARAATDWLDGNLEDVAVWAGTQLTATQIAGLAAAGGVGQTRFWVPVRRQQPFRETEGWNKSFQISLVSQYSQIFGWNLKTTTGTAAGTPVVMENQGNYPSYPIIRIRAVSGNTTTVTDGHGGTFKTLNTLSLASGEIVDFDMLNHTGVFTQGARNGQSATRYIDFTSITQWPSAVTGNNTFTLASGAGGSMDVSFRDTWA